MKLGKIISAGLVSLAMTTAAMAQNYLQLTIMNGHNLKKMDSKGSDPYVEWEAGEQKGTSHAIWMKKGTAAEWNYIDAIEIDNSFEEIDFEVKEKDGGINIFKLANKGKTRKYGSAKLRLSDIEPDTDIKIEINGKNSFGDNNKQAYITVRFTEITTDQFINILKQRKS
ncbi:MAG: C2 domain-containing protein [Oligoflexales bacterium]